MDPMDLVEVSTRVSRRSDELGFDRLTIPEQVFYVVWTLEADVNNGGFDQYFFNSWGDHADVAPDAFRAIGARKTAAIVERATQVFGAGGPPKARPQRQEALSKVRGQAKSVWGEAEKEFFAYPDDLPTLLKLYVATNLASFR